VKFELRSSSLVEREVRKVGHILRDKARTIREDRRRRRNQAVIPIQSQSIVGSLADVLVRMLEVPCKAVDMDHGILSSPFLHLPINLFFIQTSQCAALCAAVGIASQVKEALAAPAIGLEGTWDVQMVSTTAAIFPLMCVERPCPPSLVSEYGEA